MYRFFYFRIHGVWILQTLKQHQFDKNVLWTVKDLKFLYAFMENFVLHIYINSLHQNNQQEDNFVIVSTTFFGYTSKKKFSIYFQLHMPDQWSFWDLWKTESTTTWYPNIRKNSEVVFLVSFIYLFIFSYSKIYIYNSVH